MKKTKERSKKSYLDFLLKLLQATADYRGDKQLVYPILVGNLNKIDENLAKVLQSWATDILLKVEQRQAERIAFVISDFSTLISEFPLGNRAINLEISIAGYESSTIVFTREALPHEWANVQNNLGTAYRHRIHEERADNLESAISFHLAALEVYTYKTFPQEWASVQNNLGNAYSNRVKGDPADNMEQAITAYKYALQVFTRKASPEKWALLQNNLAVPLRKRIQGEKADNLEQAIAALENALEVYNPQAQAFRELWAMTQINLANAYVNKIQGNKADNLKRAITTYSLALQVYTHEDFPEKWALIQTNQGCAFLNCGALKNSTEDLELAIRCVEAALQVYTCEAFPSEWALAQVILGTAQFGLGQIWQAIECFQLSLKIYKPTALPLKCFMSGCILGNTALSQGLWTEAIEGYGVAIEAVETSRTWVNSESRRQEILAEGIDVYEKMVQACINAGQLTKAIEYVERSRSKRLVDLMASNDLYSVEEIRPEVEKLLQLYENLQEQIDQERSRNSSDKRELNGVEGKTSDRASFQAYNETIEALEAEKQQVWNQLRRLDPVLAGEIKVDAPDFAAMQQLIDQPTTAILSCYTTQNDTHIFILRKDQITLHSCKGQGLETLQGWIFQNWLLPYVSDWTTWKNQINTFLTELAERLHLPQLFSQHLEGIEELILVPHLYLHQIPFAALPIGNGQFLGDKFLIRYTPSCQVLEFCKNRDSWEDSLTYGIVEDATEDLPFASFEGEQIAKAYNVTETNRLRGPSQATKSNYHQLAKRVQVLHTCHHAESRLDNPLESKLKLGDGDITLGQLMTPGWRLPNLLDVFLSCCETGLGVTPITDDILTLSTGFLCAGARSVVSTLWSVNDLATALFSIFYYQHRQQGKNRPESLRQAQIKLRELKKEEFL